MVAALCLSIVSLKAALAAHLDTRLRNFLDGMDDMQVRFEALASQLCAVALVASAALSALCAL